MTVAKCHVLMKKKVYLRLQWQDAAGETVVCASPPDKAAALVGL